MGLIITIGISVKYILQLVLTDWYLNLVSRTATLQFMAWIWEEIPLQIHNILILVPVYRNGGSRSHTCGVEVFTSFMIIATLRHTMLAMALLTHGDND